MGRPDAAGRVIIGITGASGARFGVRLLEALRETDVETHLVMCDCSRGSVIAETGRDPEEIRRLADRVYAPWNQAARISSGSFLTRGMIVAPCSSKSLASIALGFASNLIHRAADVVLKEGRPLALVVQESSLSPVHDENVRLLRQAGAAIISPSHGAVGSQAEAMDETIAALLDRFRIERVSAEWRSAGGGAGRAG